MYKALINLKKMWAPVYVYMCVRACVHVHVCMHACQYSSIYIHMCVNVLPVCMLADLCRCACVHVLASPQCFAFN